MERGNLHVHVVLAVSDEHHKLNRPHLMDHIISTHQQTRHILVRAQATEYGLHAAEKRDSLATFRRGLSAKRFCVYASLLVFAQITRPHCF